MKTSITAYSRTLSSYKQLSQPRPPASEFIDPDDPDLKWSRQTKASLEHLEPNSFSASAICRAMYRPFFPLWHYFADFWNEERYQMPRLFPATLSEAENMSIIVKSSGEWPFFVLASNRHSDYQPQGGSQCFTFYAYNEDGTNRRENVTDWVLTEFRTYYSNPGITKWNIFHATYAVLHHPEYRTRYAANLKRELPRIPFPPGFHAFAAAGKRLMELHIDYEQQPEYKLEQIEDPKAEVTFRVERMRLNPKDRSELRYNDFLTLRGIPLAAFDYRLGNRSALEWVIDQYRVSTDTRSGIVNDPNREDDPQYILRLIGQVITVSLETQQIIAALPPLNLDEPAPSSTRA